VLKEFQLRPDPRMPLRMRAYSGLAAERYDCPVYAVVINILPPRGQVSIPDRYESEWLGLHARQDYRVINLWQIEADLVFQLPIPSLLPFVTILQGGGTEPIIRRALNELRNNELMWCLIFPVKQSYSDGWGPLNNRRGDHKPTNELWAGSVPLLGGGRGGVEPFSDAYQAPQPCFIFGCRCRASPEQVWTLQTPPSSTIGQGGHCPLHKGLRVQHQAVSAGWTSASAVMPCTTSTEQGAWWTT
jgi:hypothetical protein